MREQQASPVWRLTKWLLVWLDWSVLADRRHHVKGMVYLIFIPPNQVHTYKPTTVFRSMYLLIRLKGAKETSHSVKHRQAKSTDLNLNVSVELMLATSVPAD